MRKLFIKVRYDRMYNEDFQILAKNIKACIGRFNLQELYLEETMIEFNIRTEPLIKDLTRKQRKMPQSDSIVELRKKVDELVTALLLYVKSLKRAAFEEQVESIEFANEYIRKRFKNFIHSSRVEKKTVLYYLFEEQQKNPTLYAAFEQTGILRFTQELKQVNDRILFLEQQRTALKLKGKLPGSTLIAKEQLIDELKFLFLNMERLVVMHPERDYKMLISQLNTLLIKERAQLRNLATRRKTAKNKLNKQKPDEQNEVQIQ